jgi:hypothetical protein
VRRLAGTLQKCEAGRHAVAQQDVTQLRSRVSRSCAAAAAATTTMFDSNVTSNLPFTLQQLERWLASALAPPNPNTSAGICKPQAHSSCIAAP